MALLLFEKNQPRMLEGQMSVDGTNLAYYCACIIDIFFSWIHVNCNS